MDGSASGWTRRRATTLPPRTRRPRRPASPVEPPHPRDGDRMLIACEGGPCRSQLVRYPPPVEIPEGRRSVYVLDERGSPDRPEYVYVFIEERM